MEVTRSYSLGAGRFYLYALDDAQQTYACLRSVRALNTLDTSWQCIMGLLSALGQYSNSLGQIMHSPLALALSALDRHCIVLVHKLNPIMHCQLVSSYNLYPGGI